MSVDTELKSVSTGDRLLQGVLAYEHPELVARLQKKMGLSREEAEKLFKDMLRFLYLCATTRRRLAPSESIDEAWHNFILYTRNYSSFCNKYFGRFLHHSPTPTLVPHVAPTPGDTFKLATGIFGQLSPNWAGNLIDGSCECGGSTNCQND